MLPNVKKELHCIKCGGTTNHTLTATKDGCSWQCTICSNFSGSYSFEEMINTVTTKVLGLPRKPTLESMPDTDNLKVFLKYHGPEADEKEASTTAIKEHIYITGELPKKGDSLLARPPGIKHPLMAVPYGEVTRIKDETETD